MEASKLINLDNGLFGILVPIEIKEFEFIFYSRSGKFLTEKNGKTLNNWKTKVPNENLDIVGTASLEEIDFDVEYFVRNDEYPYKSKEVVFSGFQCYWSYQENTFKNISKEQSFYSLLQSKGAMPNENYKILILKKL